MAGGKFTESVAGDRRAAADRYAQLFERAVRPLTLPSILGNLVAGGSPLAFALIDDVVEHGAEDRTAYLAVRKALERRGTLVGQAVDDLVIYEHRTDRRLGMIREGLDALKVHFDLVDERSAAAA